MTAKVRAAPKPISRSKFCRYTSCTDTAQNQESKYQTSELPDSKNQSTKLKNHRTKVKDYSTKPKNEIQESEHWTQRITVPHTRIRIPNPRITVPDKRIRVQDKRIKAYDTRITVPISRIIAPATSIEVQRNQKGSRRIQRINFLGWEVVLCPNRLPSIVQEIYWNETWILLLRNRQQILPKTQNLTGTGVKYCLRNHRGRIKFWDCVLSQQDSYAEGHEIEVTSWHLCQKLTKVMQNDDCFRIFSQFF